MAVEGDSVSGARRRRSRRSRSRREAWALHFVDRRRTIGSLMLVAGTVLFTLSVHGVWWYTEQLAFNPLTSAQVQHVVVSFSLGGSVSCSTYNWPRENPCENVSSAMAGAMGAAYVAAGFAVVGLAAATAVASVVTILGNAGVNFGRTQLLLSLWLVLGIALVAAGILAGTASVGPGPQANSYCWALSVNITTCPSFWGGTPSGLIPGGCLPPCSDEIGWGGGIAYYESLAATGLCAFAYVLLRMARKGPYSRAEHDRWAAENRPVSIAGPGTSGPTLGPSAPTTPSMALYEPSRPTSTRPWIQVRKEPWTCPTCQFVNSPWAALCSRCRTPRP